LKIEDGRWEMGGRKRFRPAKALSLKDPAFAGATRGEQIQVSMFGVWVFPSCSYSCSCS